ncbi:MAG: epoxyqueuosine reductase [Lysobacteraceae bacterium]|nr:MAG: epoxyqueuosine reductase [Xanthomonadaceae bacterium]
MALPSGASVDSGLVDALRAKARELGFDALGVSGIELAEDEARLLEWLARQRHGEMDYMARHGTRRARPAELVPGTLRVICARMDYWPGEAADPWAVLHDPERAYVSRYALGRDYHKVLRQRLKALCDWLGRKVGPFGYRVFTDSAPVLEKPLARNAGLGWIGKHTNLIDPRHGSYFFLGEIYTDLPLPVDPPSSTHCGRCTRCIPACPTGAIVAPFQLDARRCISYLTIEHPGSIPEPLRPALGNRIYGCDDCQLVCPWNKFARPTRIADFAVRHGLDAASLVELFAWDEATFLARTEGMAIRRIGWERWQRNLAVALGNAPTSAAVVAALEARLEHPSALVREHVAWALAQHRGGTAGKARPRPEARAPAPPAAPGPARR